VHPDQRLHIILVEDSRLMAMCWGIDCQDKHSLSIYSTPASLLADLPRLRADPQNIFILDLDFAGLDPMGGVELAQRLRVEQLHNTVFLYSGFTEGVSQSLLDSGLISGVFSKDLAPGEVINEIVKMQKQVG